jgi:radical SAM/Cys-rich protein
MLGCVGKVLCFVALLVLLSSSPAPSNGFLAPPLRPSAPLRYFSSSPWTGLDGLEERTQGSLIPETLQGMENDEDFKRTTKDLLEQGQEKLTLEEKKRRRRALEELGLPSFRQLLAEQGIEIRRSPSTILQLNIGLHCNQACSHCHVESSPLRTETMSREVADECLRVLAASPSVTTLDLTGGAPELNAEFRYLVESARGMGIEVIDRCNLTVLQEPGQEDLAEFLAEQGVRVVASLPCYSAKNVNMQRGNGVFDRSIQGLLRLNALGYGRGALRLDLVYNPLGAFLPPDQSALELQYKDELHKAFGIDFDSLFTITNMPIKRFADFLYRKGQLKEYMQLLVENFNAGATQGLMCKDTVSIGWDGMVYDCDFNQQLALPTLRGGGLSISDIQSLDDLSDTDIQLGNHCFGCTAGAGSSCQGTTE